MSSWQPPSQNSVWQPSFLMKRRFSNRWIPADANAWYVSDYGNVLFQDVEGTTLATENADPVERWKSRVGGEEADMRKIHSGSSELIISDGVTGVRINSDRPLNSLNLDIARNIGGFTLFAVVTPQSVNTANYGVVWAAYYGLEGATGSDRRNFRILLRRNNGEWNIGGRRLDTDGLLGSVGEV